MALEGGGGGSSVLCCESSSTEDLSKEDKKHIPMGHFVVKEDDLDAKYIYIFNYFYLQYCIEKRKELIGGASLPQLKYRLEDLDALDENIEHVSAITDAIPKYRRGGLSNKPVSKSCSTTPTKEKWRWRDLHPTVAFCSSCSPRANDTNRPSSPSPLEATPDTSFDGSLAVEIEELLEPARVPVFPGLNRNVLAASADQGKIDTLDDTTHERSDPDNDVHTESYLENFDSVDNYEEDPWLEFNCLEETVIQVEEEELMALSADGEVLCGNRVSQMTRTYHDIDAVTRLLQEKERDLELAARIGQQLLARNRCLEEKNSTLEAEICSSTEKITQLKHDLLMKTDLLQIYTNDVDDSSVDSTPTSLRHINVDLLQRKVKNLENENVYLREEASQLATDTQTCEEKEKELVNDVIRQLNEANFQVNQLNDDLSKKIEDNLRLQEEATQYLAQVVDLQATNKRIVRENEELGSLVGVARECQQELTTELAELKEKYAEVLDLLHDTQEQLRKVQKKNFPGSRGTHLGTGSLFSSFHSGSDSIASELHSLSSGEESHEKPEGSKNVSRIFDTVRISSRLSSSLTSMGYGSGSVFSTPTKQASQTHLHLSTPIHAGGRYSPFSGLSSMSMGGGSSGLPSLDSGAESDASFPTDSEDNYPASRAGVPGWPGTPDLDSCLRRLAPRDRNNLNNYLPYGCRTPDSIMSTGSLKSGTSGYSSQDWKLPQKLQIVKPIEGSLTLHQWSRLATPHLGGLLEDREGIAMKGATNANLNLELYSMSDLEEEEEEEEAKEAEASEEEDEEDLGYPGKQFVSTSGVFTYTNSTVLHPDEVTNLTSSLAAAQMSTIASTSISEFNLPATPSHIVSKPLSRRGSTATFSTNLGLAKHLRERGFAHEDSSRVFFTATPANSPDHTSPGSPEEQSYKLPGFDDLAKRLHAGASFLRRTFYRSTSHPESEASTDGHKINLMERVQALGVERLVSGNLPHSVGAVVTSRPRSTPPLLHLSNLIRSNAKPSPSVGEQNTVSIDERSISSTHKVSSPEEHGPKIHPGVAMGIPGRPGAGHLDSRLSQLKPGQRADLGTVGDVGGRPRPSTLGSVPTNFGKRDEKIGTVGWTSLGRKGGLL